MGAVWTGLAVLVVAFVAGGALVAVRGLEAWRVVRRFQGTVGEATSALTDAATLLEERAGALEQAAPRLEQSVGRLRASVAVLQIELGVLQAAREPLMRFRAAAMPRK
jgi:hypothetical protein